jgi:hypothetical protein
MKTKISLEAARDLARRIVEEAPSGGAVVVGHNDQQAVADKIYCEAFEIALEVLLSAKVKRTMARCIADEVAAEYAHQ